jgi:hypothetical protein
MTNGSVPEVRATLEAFTGWLDQYGETSHDHQSFFAGPIGGAAKSLYYRHRSLGTLAVAPMIFCEAFVPSARALFWKRTRFPIADAHYASGFAFLAAATGKNEFHHRAVHFLEQLIATRCPGFDHYAWGYPFDWVTMKGTLPESTPMVTTIGYAYEAFRQVYQLDGDTRWQTVMRSIAEHARLDYKDFATSPTAWTCAYTPRADDTGAVINASAYRACLLTTASKDFANPEYARIAEGNLNFVLQSQNADGSWFYSADGKRDFVDHFHTCFVLKALAKIEALTGNPACSAAITRGVEYYVQHLFEESLPKPFAQAPRMTVYRRELYDYAECINLATLLCGRFPALDALLPVVVGDVTARWRKSDGSFRARQLLFGWDNVPMHRWAQAQLFRSLCFLHSRQSSASVEARIQKEH